jgi:hypothetical protein
VRGRDVDGEEDEAVKRETYLGAIQNELFDGKWVGEKVDYE